MQMPPRLRQLRFAAVVALPLAVSSCGLRGDCIYESRHVTAEGSVVENGLQIARGTVNVGGMRDGYNRRSLSWDIFAVQLDGHILSAALTDRDQPGVIILELPFLQQSEPGYIRVALDQENDAPAPALGGVFELVAANRAVLELRTDLASRPLVRIPHAVTQHGDWSRPYCS